MNLSLLLVGVVKLAIGVFLGALGVVVSYRVVARTLKGGTPLVDNPAAGTLYACALVAVALLTRNSLLATYDTIDLAVHQGGIDVQALLRVLAHGVLHIGLALVLGTALLVVGVALFNRLTPGVDEVAAVGQGKLGPALVLGAILIVLALLSAPGLEALLSGLVPFPQLPQGTMVPNT